MNNSSQSAKNDEGPSGAWKRFKNLFRTAPQTTEDMVAIVGAATEHELIDDDANTNYRGST